MQQSRMRKWRNPYLWRNCSVHLSRMNEDRNPLTTRVDDVLYPPQTHSSLISLGQSSEKGIDFKAVGSPSFGKNRCYCSSNWSGVSSQQFEVVFQNLILSSKEIILWMEHYITAGLATRWRKRLERMDGIHKEKVMWTALFSHCSSILPCGKSLESNPDSTEFHLRRTPHAASP